MQYVFYDLGKLWENKIPIYNALHALLPVIVWAENLTDKIWL